MADLGPLAAALAKAQGEFGPVTKDKTVRVTSKSGQSYTFAYAPLDSILNTVRAPLRDNGLVVTQLLDSEALVTMLLHESGAYLEARTPMPAMTDIQAYGSAVTYLRRYAIQALLGIAAEEDDDGNRSTGGHAAPLERPVPGAPRIASDRRPQAVETFAEAAAESPFQTSEQGVVEFAKSGPADGELRSGPSGPFLVFRLTGQGSVIPQVAAYGPLAESLSFLRQSTTFLAGMDVICSGVIDRVPFPNGGNRTFQRMTLARIERLGPDGWTLPSPAALSEPVVPTSTPAPSPEDMADLEAVTETLFGGEPMPA